MNVLVYKNPSGYPQHWLRISRGASPRHRHCWQACDGKSRTRTKTRTEWVEADTVTLQCGKCQRLLANALSWVRERNGTV